MTARLVGPEGVPVGLVLLDVEFAVEDAPELELEAVVALAVRPRREGVVGPTAEGVYPVGGFARLLATGPPTADRLSYPQGWPPGSSGQRGYQ